MQELLKNAIDMAKSAGQIIRQGWQQTDPLKISEKAERDLVTEVDKAVEEYVISRINALYPSHAILSEESGFSKGSEYQWIIDPIDGTSNFSRKIPHFAISIAVQKNKNLIVGVIYDPIADELFTASEHQGAYLHDQRLQVSKAPSLVNAMIATGFPTKRQSFFPPFLECLSTIFPELLGIRRAGAATLDMAYVAAGRLDAYFEVDIREWDVAAGTLLVREAGGQVTDLSGDHQFPYHGIIAATPAIGQELIKRFEPIWHHQLQDLFLEWQKEVPERFQFS